MSGAGQGKRLKDGEKTYIVRVGMPESLLQRVNAAVSENVPKTDRSKWIVARIVEGLRRRKRKTNKPKEVKE